MPIKTEYDDTQFQASLTAAQAALVDLGPALEKSRKYMMKQIKSVFSEEGPGWEPRDESAMKAVAERIRARGQQTLRSKLKREIRRAESRLELGTGKEKTLKRRKLVLKEYDKLLKTGALKWSRLNDKQKESLHSRLARSLEKSEQKGSKILGRLSSSIEAEVTSDTLRVYSRVPWSGVHNEGGTAGHGAKIPKRTFLEWTPERVVKIAKIILYTVKEAWDQGAGGEK